MLKQATKRSSQPVPTKSPRFLIAEYVIDLTIADSLGRNPYVDAVWGDDVSVASALKMYRERICFFREKG